MKKIMFSFCPRLFILLVIAFNIKIAKGSEIERGQQIFEERRCGMCHAIGGSETRFGPDLRDIGNRRNGVWMKKFLKDPVGTVPGAKMLPVKATEEDLSSLVAYLLSLKK